MQFESSIWIRKSSYGLRKSSYAFVVPVFGCLLLAGCQSLLGCRSKTDFAPPISQAPQTQPPNIPPNQPSPSDQARLKTTNDSARFDENHSSAFKAVDVVQSGNEVQPASAAQMTNAAIASDSSPALKVTVSGLEPGAGPLRLAVFHAANSFPNHESAAKKHSVEVTGDVVATQVAADANTIAIAAYQDLNNDGKLNKGMFGIPTEPYGFSNNAKGSMGPPSFESAVLRATKSTEIKLQKVKL